MNKRAITFFAMVGMTVGAYLPVTFGWDKRGLEGPSLLGGLVGGIAAIWLAMKLGKFLNL